MRMLRVAVAVAAVLALAGCHVLGHAPPGQIKKVVAPPPGQAKKVDDD